MTSCARQDEKTDRQSESRPEMPALRLIPGEDLEVHPVQRCCNQRGQDEIGGVFLAESSSKNDQHEGEQNGGKERYKVGPMRVCAHALQQKRLTALLYAAKRRHGMGDGYNQHDGERDSYPCPNRPRFPE